MKFPTLLHVLAMALTVSLTALLFSCDGTGNQPNVSVPTRYQPTTFNVPVTTNPDTTLTNTVGVDSTVIRTALTTAGYNPDTVKVVKITLNSVKISLLDTTVFKNLNFCDSMMIYVNRPGEAPQLVARTTDLYAGAKSATLSQVGTVKLEDYLKEKKFDVKFACNKIDEGAFYHKVLVYCPLYFACAYASTSHRGGFKADLILAFREILQAVRNIEGKIKRGLKGT
jgi:hypothetical protein